MQEEKRLLKTPKLAFREISVTELRGGQYQPRHSFSEEGLKSLAETINRVGVLEPLLVRPLTSSGYEIIAGERRWRAAQISGLKTVPCLVGYYDDEKASQIALIENVSREDLNVMDESTAISRIVEEFNYTHEEMGAILGRTRSHISNLLRLLRLDQRVQAMLMAGEIAEAHGKILAGLPLEKQYFFAQRCIEKQLSMRALSKEIKLTSEKNKKGPIENNKKDKKDLDVSRLEREISDQFGHEVKFSLEKNKSGYVNIRFFNLDEFDAILEKFKTNK